MRLNADLLPGGWGAALRRRDPATIQSRALGHDNWAIPVPLRRNATMRRCGRGAPPVLNAPLGAERQNPRARSAYVLDQLDSSGMMPARPPEAVPGPSSCHLAPAASRRMPTPKRGTVRALHCLDRVLLVRGTTAAARARRVRGPPAWRPGGGPDRPSRTSWSAPSRSS